MLSEAEAEGARSLPRGAHAEQDHLALATAGRFELVQEIGSGSSSTVHRARLLVPYGGRPAGTEVAIKFLRRELAADERARARLLAEGQVGQKLRHPNVAEIYGFETIELPGHQTSFLVMQYVQGTTLREFVARAGAPVEDLTRRIGADAAKGLHALHRRGLVHRDVKPENLVLTPDSQLKIVDLGLARPIGTRGAGSGSSPGRSSGFGLAGSVAYAAPEALRGASAGPRSDLYSLGIVLFEVTTGRHPFSATTTADEMLDAHLHRPPPRPSHLRARVSPFLDQLLLDLLQKDPEQRPRDGAELARRLEQGERSEYWRRHEAKAPALASRRRLLRMRRPAETPFCGRKAELAALQERFSAAQKGRGSVVVVDGPEGIGRRRLLDEAIQGWLDAKEPPLYLGGEADSGFGKGEPFASSLLDWLLHGDGRHSPNAFQRALVGARRFLQLDEADAAALAAVTMGASIESSEVRADRLASALASLARPGRVLVLRVDHSERLDTSGRLVLSRLAASCPQLHLLLLLATGTEGQALHADLHLELAGLEEAPFLAFGRALFRGGEPVETFLRDAHRVLSGLPGNLIEALDHLAQAGELRGRAGDYHLLSPAAEPRPAPGHLERFRHRVAGLEPQHRAVLAAAAVLGERCELEALAELVGAAEMAVLETLSLFRGRIVRAQGGEVSFRHRDFQKALLRELPGREREQLHLQAAALLERRGGSRLEIGMQRSQALDHEGCLDPLLDGLEERVRAGSRRTALRIAGRLAVHLAQVPGTPANDARRLRWLLQSGKARSNAGQTEASARTFREAEALATRVGDVEASAAARTGLANEELDSGHLLAAIALLESVHDDLAARTTRAASAMAAQAHGLHGRILLYRGQAASGEKHIQAALLRVPPEEDEIRCNLLIDLARVQALSHDYATALKTLQQVESAPAMSRLPRVRLRFHLYRGQVRSVLGEDAATQDLRDAVDEAERLSLPTYGARASVFLGERQFWRERDDEAVVAFRRAVRLAQAGGDRLGEAMARGYLLRLGDQDEALEALVSALELPSLRANWLLARAVRSDAATTAQLEEVLATADLPLSLHLRALAWLDRPAAARSLVRTIAERFTQRSMRRRFLAQWGAGARM